MNEQKKSCDLKDTCGAYSPDCDDSYMLFDQESCYKPKDADDKKPEYKAPWQDYVIMVKKICVNASKNCMNCPNCAHFNKKPASEIIKDEPNCDDCNQDVPLCCKNEIEKLKNYKSVLNNAKNDLAEIVEACKSEGKDVIHVSCIDRVIEAMNESLQGE